MIISRGRRYIFIHIPKTGGTSLARALEQRAMADDILAGDTPKARKRKHRLETMQARGRLWKHSMLQDLYGPIGQDEMEQFFVFTLVRNPWDRMVSYYHWLKAQSFKHPAVALAKLHAFNDFLHQPLIVGQMQTYCYTDYTSDKHGKNCANLFIKLEQLATDIAPLEQHLGFKLDGIEHVNQSARQADWRPYYSPQSANLVAEACARDIARFNYSFERGV